MPRSSSAAHRRVGFAVAAVGEDHAVDPERASRPLGLGCRARCRRRRAAAVRYQRGVSRARRPRCQSIVSIWRQADRGRDVGHAVVVADDREPVAALGIHALPAEQAHAARPARRRSVVTMPPSPVVMILLPKKLNVGDVAEAADGRPAVLGAVRLGGVLDDAAGRAGAAMRADRVHVGRMAVQVHGDDRLGPRRDLRRDRGRDRCSSVSGSPSTSTGVGAAVARPRWPWRRRSASGRSPRRRGRCRAPAAPGAARSCRCCTAIACRTPQNSANARSNSSMYARRGDPGRVQAVEHVLPLATARTGAATGIRRVPRSGRSEGIPHLY